MSNFDLFSMSFKNLWRRKLRTFLTILGVVIGTAAIIVMLSLGFGMKYNNQKQIEQMGSIDTINVESYPIYDHETGTEKEALPLNDKAVAEFEKIEHVAAVLPMLSVNGPQLISGKYESYGNIIGVDPKTFSQFGIKTKWGRLLQEGDGAVAFFGARAASNFYNPNSRSRMISNDKTVDIQKDKIEIAIGQEYDFETKRSTFKKKYKINICGETTDDDYNYAWSVYVPLEFAEKIKKDIKKINDSAKAEDSYNSFFGGRENSPSKYSSILVKVDDIKNVRYVYEKIKSMNYNANSSIEITDALNKGVEQSQKILGGIGAISLLVAAIGIANTMVMSIYERIKEIGIMKVIGASINDIKKMFLTESAIIGLFGGLLGVAVSYGASWLLNYFATKGSQDPDAAIGGILNMGMGMAEEGTKISIIPLWLVGVALIFSTIVGIISGYYPAKKATKLSPLEAIRTQ